MLLIGLDPGGCPGCQWPVILCRSQFFRLCTYIIPINTHADDRDSSDCAHEDAFDLVHTDDNAFDDALVHAFDKDCSEWARGKRFTFSSFILEAYSGSMNLEASFLAFLIA